MEMIEECKKTTINIIYSIAKRTGCQILLTSVLFYKSMGSWPNLRCPKTFNEKITWLKIHDKNDKYHKFVDKYEVKSLISEIIGSRYVIPTLGIWNNFDDINFDNLPNKFVLKTTTGGGNSGVVICEDKSTFDINSAKEKLLFSQRFDIYNEMCEWAYKGLESRIIAEQFIESSDNNDLYDYKFFCFDGEPKLFKIDFGRQLGNHHANYYDLDGKLLELGEELCMPDYQKDIPLPLNFNEMISVARTIARSVGAKFLRVDLYNVEGTIYFGETTFYPNSGNGKFVPEEWDYKLGSLININ